MPTDIVKTEILVTHKRERVLLMDDYGSAYHLYIAVSAAAQRQPLIDQHTKLMNTNQDAMEAYAKANGHDLSAQKAAGIAKKQALIAANSKK